MVTRDPPFPRLRRRRFLEALASGGVLYALGRSPGVAASSYTATKGSPDGYKALVCVYLVGGNDSWSMLLPQTASEYSAYAAARGNLSVARASLLPVTLDGASGVGYALHPSMSALRPIVDAGRCAIVANVGTLEMPLNLAQFLQDPSKAPPQLFSHNDQQDQWNTLRGRATSTTGWAGRIADVLVRKHGEPPLPIGLSLAGSSTLQTGLQTVPYVLGEAGPTKFVGTDGTTRFAHLQSIADAAPDSIYAHEHAKVQLRALRYVQRLSSVLDSAPRIRTRFPEESALGRQLKTVARVISARDKLQVSRQIFLVAVSGYDTHDSQLADQPSLFRELGTALAAFYASTVELGVAAEVTTCTLSEFGRTLTSNGDGTDHGWGGLQFVIGDSIRGARIYGHYPPLSLGSPLDVGGGRLIPTVSVDQMVATLAQWIGVDASLIDSIAPSIQNFPQRDLGFFL